MIMPYSTKATGAAASSGAPDKVDFDHLWQVALKPAIEVAGYEAVRANEDVGALIIQEMIERLAISDLVLADISIPNGNVYYEVGMRHAAQRKGCILTSATWAKPLFDVDQMRQIRYPLPAESITDETASEVIKTISEAIPVMSVGDSPFYQVFPEYPRYDEAKATAFRENVEELSRFQADILAARSAKGDDRKARAKALLDRYFTPGSMKRAVALELMFTVRDCTDWQTTLAFIDKLPSDLQQLPLVKEQRALALSNSGNFEDAIGALRQLINLSGDTAERHGLLGGRYKARWRATRDPADLDSAIDEYEMGMKLDLNNYYPSSNLARLYRTRNESGDSDKANIAAAITIVACERARSMNAKDPWLNQTLLGAAFDAGNIDKARELARSVRTENAAEWMSNTTLTDCETAVKFHDENKQQVLLQLIATLRAKQAH
jgi:tetratricopeptide (TPR) repeat protein